MVTPPTMFYMVQHTGIIGFVLSIYPCDRKSLLWLVSKNMGSLGIFVLRPSDAGRLLERGRWRVPLNVDL